MTDDKKNDVYENGKYLSLRLRSLHKVVFTIFREAVSDVVLPFSIKEIMKTRKKNCPKIGGFITTNLILKSIEEKL